MVNNADAYMFHHSGKCFIGRVEKGRMIQAIEAMQVIMPNGGINLAGLLLGSFQIPKNALLIKLDRKSDYFKCYLQVISNIALPNMGLIK